MLPRTSHILLLATISTVRAGTFGYDIFSDANCEHKIGDGEIGDYSCSKTTGFGSMKWNGKGSYNGYPKSDVTVVTLYTRNDCGCPTCGSHGYSGHGRGCFGGNDFASNAIGLACAFCGVLGGGVDH